MPVREKPIFDRFGLYSSPWHPKVLCPLSSRLAQQRTVGGPLELGCGTGTTALRLAGDVQSYLATDISAEMIAIAEEKRAAGVLPALAFRTMTAEALKPEAVQFNAVLGFNLSPSGPRPARHAAPHPCLACSGGLVHLQDTVRRIYESTHPPCLAARDARDRQGSLCRCFPGGGAGPGHMCGRLRHSCRRKPCNQGQRQPSLYRGAQEMK